MNQCVLRQNNEYTKNVRIAIRVYPAKYEDDE